MTRDELLKAISAASLFPIPVEGGAEADDVAGMLFLGDVAGFVEAAAALGARCVFVASKALAESDFLHQEQDAGFDDDRTEDAAPAAIDLTTLQPELKEYKDRIGQHAAHRIWLQVPSVKLELLVRAPWWEQFSKLRGEAVEQVKRKRESAWAEEAEQGRRREEELLKRLRSFIDDAEFVKLPTQVAMQAYAVEQAPELEGLGDKTLRAEIRALDGKIKARGLRAKKPTQMPTAPPPKPES